MARPKKTDQKPPTDQTEENAMQNAEPTDIAVEKPKKKGTPPGWKPAAQLPKLKAPPGFTAKWCNPSKLTDRRSEGWEIMKPSDHKGREIINIDVNDVGSLTGALRYRDLVAIMLPNELKEARDNWHRNENEEAMKSILKETDDKLQEKGVQTYVPKGQSGRIVID